MTAAPTRNDLDNDAERGSHCGCSGLLPSVKFTRHPRMNKQTKTITPNRVQSAAVCAVSGKLVPEKNGSTYSRHPKEQAEDGGQSHPAKAVAFWARLAERRKQPGNCSRCGKPNGNGKARCEKCVDYQRRYKLRLLVKRQEYTPAECVAMVKQCRREVSKLREIIKKMQSVQRYKYNREWKEKQMRRKYLKPVSHAEAMDYLSDTNHAYEHDETQAG